MENSIDSDQLKALQRPLKKQYRDAPASAIVTLSASGEIDDRQITCSVQTGKALVEAGLHPASGGDGSFACSGDMLLEALAACAGVTLRSVAVNRGLPVRGGTVTAEGDLDFRGTMGVDAGAPVGFAAIRLHFDLDCDLSENELDDLLDVTERYCVVFQTIAGRPELSASIAAGRAT